MSGDRSKRDGNDGGVEKAEHSQNEHDHREKGSAFANAMSDVRPLPDRDKYVQPAKHASPQPPAHTDSRPITSSHDGLSSAVTFHHPEVGEPLLGTAGGIQTRQLRRLRAGKLRPETEIDLHHLRARDAERLLVDFLLEAHASGKRCVRVIHGRGLCSADGPVIRSALPGWLAQPPVGPLILAFAPATGADGGPGACYVLLKRKRESR